MELACVCLGKVWRVRKWTHDPVSTAWLRGHDHELPAPRETPDGTLFEGPRELATDSDPLLEVHLRYCGSIAEAWAELGSRTVRLTNRPPGLPPSTVNRLRDRVRLASVEETFLLAERWFAAFDSIGCVNIEAEVFFEECVETTAYRVQDLEGWIADGTPLPLELGDDVAFIAFSGSPWSLYNRIFERLEAGMTDEHIEVGAFYGWESTSIELDTPFPEAGCLMAIGRAVKGPPSRTSSRAAATR